MEDQPTSSPVIKKEGVSLGRTYTFAECIPFLLGNDKITKLEWADREIFGLIMDGELKLRRDGKYHSWILCPEDLQGEDFIILP